MAAWLTPARAQTWTPGAAAVRPALPVGRGAGELRRGCGNAVVAHASRLSLCCRPPTFSCWPQRLVEDVLATALLEGVAVRDDAVTLDCDASIGGGGAVVVTAGGLSQAYPVSSTVGIEDAVTETYAAAGELGRGEGEEARFPGDYGGAPEGAPGGAPRAHEERGG